MNYSSEISTIVYRSPTNSEHVLKQAHNKYVLAQPRVGHHGENLANKPKKQ